MTSPPAQSAYTRVSPVLLLALAAGVMIVGLMFPLKLPIGPNYWDISFYLDAAHRIANGQAPGIDFRAPAGPAEFYLTYLLIKWFPAGHPFLTTQWSLQLLALPIFALVIASIDRRSRITATALALPYILFALLPLNTSEGATTPGFDGFGVYNRHPGLLLYILISTLLFVEDRGVRGFVVAACMLLLFLTKITGFATGVLICGYAALARNIRISDLLLSAVATIAALSLLQLTTGLVSAYVGDILLLASINTGSFPPRLREVVATNLLFLVCIAAIVAIEALITLRTTNETQSSRLAAVSAAFAHPFLWLASVLVFSIGFEAQNTGSQDFAYLWPVLLAILIRRPFCADRLGLAAVVAVVFATTPIIAGLLQRAARSVIAIATYQSIDRGELSTLGRVLARPLDLQTSQGALLLYQKNRTDYLALAQKGLNIADNLTVERTYQIAWLLSIQEGVRALADYERTTGRVLETIYTLDFSDPFPFLLGRKPLPQVNLALDPIRTVPSPDPIATRAIASADGVLVPHCPATLSRLRLVTIYQPALEGRQRLALSPCWDLYVRTGSDFADAGAALH